MRWNSLLYKTRKALCIGAMGLAIPALHAQAAPLYSAQVLGTAGLYGITPLDINNVGQITGYGEEGHIRYAFLWENNKLTRLSEDISVGRAINDHGQIAAYGNRYAFDLGYRYASVYSNGAVTRLPPLVGELDGQIWSDARDINRSGTVVGSASTGEEDYWYGVYADWHATAYRNGTVTDLGTLGGKSSYANSINDNGLIAGTAQLANGSYHAFLHDGTAMRDLGTLGGRQSEAAAINARGDIVGRAQAADNKDRLFMYQDGVMTDLGGASSGMYPYYRAPDMDINDEGLIVATGYNGDTLVPYIYDRGKRYDLNDFLAPEAGVTLTHVKGINNAGQIIGIGIKDGEKVTVLLNPVVPVPEPATWAMTLAGLAVAGLAARRRTPAASR